MSFAEVAAAAIRFGREGFAVQSITEEVVRDRAEASESLAAERRDLPA